MDKYEKIIWVVAGQKKTNKKQLLPIGYIIFFTGNQ
jgi:hypothetical protein